MSKSRNGEVESSIIEPHNVILVALEETVASIYDGFVFLY